MNEDESREPDPKRVKVRLQFKSGHDCIFTKELPEHLQVECSICLCVLDDPHLIDCECGASFCQPCIHPTLKEKRPCPLCNGSFSASLPARQLQRTLNSLQVYCSFKEAGCEWVGELGMIDEHLNHDVKSDTYKSSGCPYFLLKCCYCRKEFERLYLLEHETNECLKRPYKCNVCTEFESTFEDVTTKHASVCPCVILPCPNDCGVSLQRKDVDDHLATKCSLQVVSCSFSYAGCGKRLPRKDIPAHINDSLAVHMSLQAVSHQKEIKALRAEVIDLRTHIRIMPITIMLDKFASKKAAGESWSSRPFYTCLRGYKLYLNVSCNGHHDGEGTHISVYVHVTRGKHDDELEWPFQRSITLWLLDRKEGKKHYKYVVNFVNAPEHCKRRVQSEIGCHNPGWGQPKFMLHSRLSPRYLVNDTLSFRIS